MCAAAVALYCAAASAHFPAGYDLRVAHFDRARDGLHIYLRLTLPLAVGGRLGPKGEDGHHEPAPFTVKRIESAHAFYYPDVARIRAEPLTLGATIADGHRIRVGERDLTAQVLSVRAYPKGTVLPFNTLEEARQATAAGEAYPAGAVEVDAAFVVVDTHLFYRSADRLSRFYFSSTLDNRILGQPEVQNLLVDHLNGRDVVYKTTGLMSDPIGINPSRFSAAASFFRHGFEHFAFGADHLLFVLCLALSAAVFSQLVWRITGFTIGHALSVTAGFLGYVPTAAWFVPAVEACIAASIILAAIALFMRVLRDWTLAWVTVTIGVVHGFGFSLALREVLQLEGPHVTVSLAAFNLGIEAGQVIFAAFAWGLMRSLTEEGGRWRIGLERAISSACVAIAAVWVVDRTQTLIAVTL
jgi:hydrogenase/urease accessory protein HupE